MATGFLLTPAFALATEHTPLGSFCEPTGLGSPPCNPSFGSPEGLAVDQGSGDLLMIDKGDQTLSRWHPDGTPANFSALGTNVIDGKLGPGSEPCAMEPSSCDAESAIAPGGFSFGVATEVQVAVDNSGGTTDGDIYVAQGAAHAIDIFSDEGEYLGQLTKYKEGLHAEGPGEPSLGETCGVAVDPGGNVYVSEFGEPEGHVHKYEPAGALVVNADNTLNFPAFRPCTLAAGAGPSAGSVFVVSLEEAVTKFDGTTGAEQYEVDSGPHTTATVDPATGNLYLAAGRLNDLSAGSAVKEYDASSPLDATLLSTISPPSSVWGVAVDEESGNVYVAERGNPQIKVWGPAVANPTATTKPATEIASESATLNGTVNPNGAPLKSGPGEGCFFEWGETESYGEISPCAESAAEIGSGNTPVAVHAEISGLHVGTPYHFHLVAVNDSASSEGDDEQFGTLGPSVSEEAVSQVSANGAKLSGLVDPNGQPTSYSFEYITQAAYEANPPSEPFAGAAKAPVPPGSLPAEVSGSGDLSAAAATVDLVAGLSQIHYTTVTAGAFAVGQTISGSGIPSGTTITAIDPGKQVLTISQAVSKSATGVPLSAGSLTVSNLITSAGHFTAGQTITGPGIPAETKITAVTPNSLVLSEAPTEALLGAALSASGSQAVFQQLSGLSPDTAYHFRLVAANPAATNNGEDKSFATLAQAPALLPDGRAYELVSPAQKLGEPFPPEPSERLGGTCRLPRPACAPGAQEVTMTPMQSDPSGSAFTYEGQPFVGGLRAGANQYLAGRGPGGWGSGSLSSPLLDGGFKAFSADLSRGVLTQEQPLTPEAPARGGVGFANLYLWQEGALQPLLTEEPPQRDPGHQSSAFKLAYQTANVGTATTTAQPLSHVLFAANDALTEATPFAPAAPPVEAGSKEKGCEVGENCNLYEWDEGQLRLVNVLPGQPPTAAPKAVIGSRPTNSEPPDVDHAISDDGSHIFWSDEDGQLYVRINGKETQEIEDPGEFATAAADGSQVLLNDGCLYDLQEEECEDLSVDQSDVHQGGFEGILGASEDLSHVYFVDTKILTGEEENANEEEAVEEAGKLNLYLWEEGTTAFIGTLLEVDGKVAQFNGGKYGDWTASSARRTAQVSADGRYLAFMSQARLTGYDNRQLGGTRCDLERKKEGEPCYEVFTYDAASGALDCPSCNPSGQRPLGAANLSLFSNGFSEAEATPPPPHNLTTNGQGRLFFESQDVLSPADTNGHIQDVYEWEPLGVGSCRRAGGCVSLISSGHDGGDSMFVNSTPNGDDAFFTTRERLVGKDENDQIDIYDARAPHSLGEAVGFPEGETSPCGGEACKGAVAAVPPAPGAASAQFAGPGNPKPAKAKTKKQKKKHHKKHKKKQRPKQRAAAHNRGGAR